MSQRGDCQHRSPPDGNRHCYSAAVKDRAVAMYPEGSSISAIGRALAASPERVYSWIKKSRASPGDLRAGSGTAAILSAAGGDWRAAPPATAIPAARANARNSSARLARNLRFL